MPTVNASGNIFTLDASAGFDEGFVSGRVGGDARSDVDLQAGICHGLNLSAAADVRAEVEAALSLLLPAVRAEGQAFARAGLQGQLQLSPNIFERFGLTANVAAFAEASVAGELAVGLDFSAIQQAAASTLDGLAFDLFLIFLDEIRLEAGLWGKASASAMAQAYVIVDGSLAGEDEAGFRIEAGAALGLAVGTGWDFFARAGFDDPRRFVLRSIDAITDAISDEARRLLGPDVTPAIDLLELTLPIALQTAYELGQQSALTTTVSPERAVRPFVDVCLAHLQRWILNKVAALATERLGRMLEAAVESSDILAGLNASERLALENDIVAAITFLSRRTLGVDELVEGVGRVIDVVDHLGVGSKPFARPIALAWTALAGGAALRGLVSSTSAAASAGVVGAGPVVVGGVSFQLPGAPALVLDDYREVLGRAFATIQLPDAIEYVLAIGVVPAIERSHPQLWGVIVDLSDALGVEPADLIEAVLLGVAGQSLTQSDLYRDLRRWARNAVDIAVLNELLPALREAADSSTDARLYLDEVAEPSLRILVDFVFEQLDAVIATGTGVTAGAVLDDLKIGCSAVGYKIVARNLVTIQQILLQHVLTGLADAFAALEDRVRSDSTDQMITAMRALVIQQLPGIGSASRAPAEAVQLLTADLLASGREAFGPSIWTPRRLDRLRELQLQILLSIDGHVDYSSTAALADTLTQMAECAFFPNAQASRDLFGLLIEVSAEELDVVLNRSIPALRDFYLRLTLAQVEAFDRGLGTFLDSLASLIDDALGLLNEALARVDEFKQDVRDAIDAGEDAAAAIREALADPTLRQAVKDRLRSTGIENVRALLRGHTDAEIGAAVLSFLIAYDNPASQALLDLALQAAAHLADSVATVLGGTADVVEAADTLATEIVDAVLGIIPSEFIAPGLSGQAVADVIADVLSTSQLRGLLEDWLDASRAEQAARDAQVRAEADAALRQGELDDARRQQQLRDIGPLGVRVLSPAPMAAHAADGWVYPDSAPITVIVHGQVDLSFVAPGPQERVRIALNTRQVRFDASEWRVDAGAGELVLTSTLEFGRHPIEPGMNVLEVSVASGRGQITRTSVAFLADPNAPALTGPVSIDGALSTFDTSGDDHDQSEQERVAIRWDGASGLAVRGWRLQDFGSRHVFRFPDVVVPPGSVVMVHTGGSPGADTPRELHWGKGNAVWNNDGDIAHLVDDRGVLRASFSYGKPR